MKNLTFVHGKSFKKPMMSWIRIQDIIGFFAVKGSELNYEPTIGIFGR